MWRKHYSRFCILLFAVSAILLITLSLSKNQSPAGFLLILFFSCTALYFMGSAKLKQYAFTIWVFAAVSASMIYPSAFDIWFGVNLAILIIPLIQIIMFGMGTTLNLRDFERVLKTPGPVFIGIFLQYLIMPSLAMGLVFFFNFEPAIAAGIILIGCCPGGVASNVMTYLAGGNVALSVAMTAISTLVSPVMTPLLMKVLAGRFIPIDFMEMMFSILDMIIVPILAGLVANTVLYGKKKWTNQRSWLIGLTVSSLLLALASIKLEPSMFGSFAAIKGGLFIGFALVGIVSMVKLIISILKGPTDWMDKVLPVVSMAAICFIIAIITARSSEKLLSVGLLLIGAVILHNSMGYLLAYWGSRLFGLDERDCRTVAFEVGMQNGGMASGLAMGVLKNPLAALAPAIFGPLQNVSGSILATYWHGRQEKIKEHKSETDIPQ
jgi:BASS family bile acid:Na+ symporter